MDCAPPRSSISLTAARHTTHDTILPIGTEVEVFFNTNKWERAVVTGHIPEVGARNAVYYHHVFLYESDKSVLSHHQGTIMLRMRRSVHADLQRTNTPTATGGRTRRARSRGESRLTCS